MISRGYFIGIVLVALVPLALAAALYPRMPEVVPTHYGVHGQAGGFGSRQSFLLMTGGIPIGLAALLLVIPAIGPMRATFERFRLTYARISLVTLLAVNAILVLVTLGAIGWKVPMMSAPFAVVGLLMVILGNWMGKVRRNFWVGIRTPWTLANDAVWERTHRVGGPIMVVFGVVTILCGLVLPGLVATGVLAGGALLLVAWSLVYSWRLYGRLGHVDDMVHHPNDKP